VQIKLAFSKTGLGLFKVTAAIPASPKAISPREPVIAQFRDEGRFLELLRDAELDPETHARLVGTIAAAANSPDGAACCEEIDLTPEQLKILHLASVIEVIL
jgi:hypothetical protein